MLQETIRLIESGAPEWFLIENVARVPDIRVAGYNWQRFDLDQGWFQPVSRLRHWQFGSRSGVLLDPPHGRKMRGCEPAVLAHDGRTFREVCRLQGLSPDFDLPGFTVAAKIAAVGNGVPIAMGRAVARAVRLAYGLPILTGFLDNHRLVLDSRVDRRRCKCGCGRVIRTCKGRYASAACRKRAQRARDASRENAVTRRRRSA
jgi:DNA (cytosine-5)-methyltransferase 1